MSNFNLSRAQLCVYTLSKKQSDFTRYFMKFSEKYDTILHMKHSAYYHFFPSTFHVVYRGKSISFGTVCGCGNIVMNT